MPSPMYATAEDIAVRSGQPLETLNTDQVDALIHDTSVLIEFTTGLAWDDWGVTDGEHPCPADIHYVCVNRTVRVLNNPDGIRQESLGTYSYSLAADSATLTGGWTDEERWILGSYGNSTAIRTVGSLAIGYVEGAV